MVMFIPGLIGSEQRGQIEISCAGAAGLTTVLMDRDLRTGTTADVPNGRSICSGVSDDP